MYAKPEERWPMRTTGYAQRRARGTHPQNQPRVTESPRTVTVPGVLAARKRVTIPLQSLDPLGLDLPLLPGEASAAGSQTRRLDLPCGADHVPTLAQ